MAEIVVIGEALIDFFAEPRKSLAEAGWYAPRCGGAPANVAVRAAQIGGDVQFVGRVGTDAFGKVLRQTMRKNGVDVRYLIDDDARATMVAFVALVDPTSPEFTLISGANENLVAEDIPTSELEAAKVLAFGSVTLAYESRAAALDAARRARTLGVNVIFDVNYRPNIWSSPDVARVLCWEAIDTANVVKLNAEEAVFLTGIEEPRVAAKKLLERGVQLVCLTKGADGCCLLTANAEENCCSFDVDVVDATGCGDAFLAGMCVSISKIKTRVVALESEELKKIGKFANACGAIVATQTGAMESSLNSQMVEELLSAMCVQAPVVGL